MPSAQLNQACVNALKPAGSAYDVRAAALRGVGVRVLLDHAYSSTVHAAQSITCDSVIAVLDSDHGPLADQATFYIQLTRARDNVVLLTTDKEELIEELQIRTGEELSAPAAIGEQFAVPAQAPMAAIADKKAHWPVLATWRAFAEQARRRGIARFEAEGSNEAVAPILALAGGAGPPDGMPGEIVRIAAEHEARNAARHEAAAGNHVENRLTVIQACLDQRRSLELKAAHQGKPHIGLHRYGAETHRKPGRTAGRSLKTRRLTVSFSRVGSPQPQQGVVDVTGAAAAVDGS